MNTFVTVTDIIGTSGSVVCPRSEVADSIRGWFDAPTEQDRAEVSDVLADLQTSLDRGEDYGPHAAWLGITIHHYPQTEG